MIKIGGGLRSGGPYKFVIIINYCDVYQYSKLDGTLSISAFEYETQLAK